MALPHSFNFKNRLEIPIALFLIACWIGIHRSHHLQVYSKSVPTKITSGKIVRRAYHKYLAFLVSWMSLNKRFIGAMPRGIYALSRFLEKWHEDYTEINLSEKKLKFIFRKAHRLKN